MQHACRAKGCKAVATHMIHLHVPFCEGDPDHFGCFPMATPLCEPCARNMTLEKAATPETRGTLIIQSMQQIQRIPDFVRAQVIVNELDESLLAMVGIMDVLQAAGETRQ